MHRSNPRILAKLATVLFRQQAIGALSVPVVLAAVLFVLHDKVETRFLASWAIGYVLVTMVVLAQCLLYFRATAEKKRATGWMPWHAFIAGLSAAPHAVFVILVLPHSGAQVQIFLGVLFAGIAAGATVLFAASLASVMAYTGVTLVGLAGAFALSGGDLGSTLAILVVVYLAFLGNAARDFRRVLTDAIYYRQSTVDAQRHIEQHAYDRGLSDIATSVLEELRNELIPIATKMGRRRSSAATTTRQNLFRAASELGESGIEDERREKLARFIGQALRKFFDQELESWQDMQAIFSRLEAIEDVLVARDARSGSSWCTEPVDLPLVIDQAYAMTDDFAEAKFTLEVDQSVAASDPVLSDQSLLAHILRNLMINATRAIALSGQGRGLVRISASPRSDVAGRPMTEITISDNGCGVAAEDLDDFLRLGYADAEAIAPWPHFDWCVSSLEKLGGGLSVSSDGPGTGATMHIFLPTASTSTEQVLEADKALSAPAIPERV